MVVIGYDFIITQGAEGVPWRVLLSDESGPVDLSNTSIQVKYTLKKSASETFTATVTPDSDQVGNIGEAVHLWSDVDSAHQAGEYWAEFTVTWPEPIEQVWIFPAGEKKTIRIYPS